jgi:hypothetical protein
VKEKAMKTQWIAGWRALALVGLAAVGLPAMAAPDTVGVVSLPVEQYQGPVGYVTGGIGQQEAKLFERQLNKHPLAIELLERAGKANEFTADAMVKIADRHGHTMLDARAGGPFMLVDLPPGRYSIQATLNDHTLRKSAVLITQSGTARATFEFPGLRAGRLRVSLLEGAAEGGLGG